MRVFVYGTGNRFPLSGFRTIVETGQTSKRRPLPAGASISGKTARRPVQNGSDNESGLTSMMLEATVVRSMQRKGSRDCQGEKGYSRCPFSFVRVQPSRVRRSKRRTVRWQMAAARASPVSTAQSGLTPSILPTMKLTCAFSAQPTPTRDFLMTVGA